MEKLSFDALEFIAKENKNKKILITFHSMGDTDAVSSAVSLLDYFTNARVATPDFITPNAARILKRLGFEPEAISNKFDESADLVIMTDVNNFEDCGPFRYRLEGFRGNILIIDHHMPKEIEKEHVSAFNDENYNSACSIVYELLKTLGVQVGETTSKILLSGILSDSADLKNAGSKTFMQIGELLGVVGMDYPTFLDQMVHVADVQGRAKTLNDLVKAQVDLYEDLLIMHGKAHGHANIAADYAIKIGADVGFFYAENEREMSFSARLRPPLDKKFGIHLGVMMKTIAKRLNGNGGGHPCAAGAYGPLGSARPEEIESYFISEILRRAKVANATI